MMKMYCHAIAIDPGVHTGWAEAVDGKLTAIETLTFWSAYERLMSIQLTLNDEYPRVTLYIEDSGKIPILYRKGCNLAEMTKIARNIGINQAHGNLLAIAASEMDYNVIRTSPLRSGTKTQPAAFKKLTGWDEKTSEHGRDAAMILWTQGRISKCRENI